MSFTSWVRGLKTRSRGRGRTFFRKRPQSWYLQLETLEDRTLLSVLPAAVVSGQTSIGITNPPDPNDPILHGFSPTLIQDPTAPLSLVEFHAGTTGLLVGSY